MFSALERAHHAGIRLDAGDACDEDDDLLAELDDALGKPGYNYTYENPHLPGSTKLFKTMKQESIVVHTKIDCGDNPELVASMVKALKDHALSEARQGDGDEDADDEPEEPANKKRKRKNTKKNSQYPLRIPELTIDGIETAIVVRHEDYVTDNHIKRGNFRNCLTMKRVYGVTRNQIFGATIKLFVNGSIQGTGWKSVQEFESFINTVCERLELPKIVPGASKIANINGGAYMRLLPDARINMQELADKLADMGCSVTFDPASGNNGLNLKLPDAGEEKTSMVFSKGYVKLWAMSEEQLARVIATAEKYLTEALKDMPIPVLDID